MSRETAEKALSKAPIRLEEAERSVLDALLAVARAEGKGTVLRVAGGWVRDKLLGRPCHDIDIALDNVSGSEFADAVASRLRELGHTVSGVGTISRNPDQSKHLETATAKVMGYDIDFVNLRTEEYADSSRIPTIVRPSPAPAAPPAPAPTHPRPLCRPLARQWRTRSVATSL